MRTLSLSREVLAELTSAELGAVVGGTGTQILCLTDPCLTDPCLTPQPSELNCGTSLAVEACGG